jgi:hypothetical protein
MTATSKRPAWLDLFLISVGSLYLELAFIRLLASEIRVFAYFKNFPLLAAFIGLGLGCFVAGRRPIRLWMSALFSLLLTAAAAFSERLHLTNLFFPDPSLYTWRGFILSPSVIQQAQVYPILGHFYGHVGNGTLLLLIGLTSFAIIAALFAATSLVFYPLGQVTGALFERVSPLRAYAVNVSGALLGSLAFGAVSYLELGPVAWVAPCMLLLVYFAWTRGDRLSARVTAGVALAMLGLLALGTPTAGKLVWSPYYRIGLTPGVPETDDLPDSASFGWTLRVNHDYFQRAVDLRPEARARAPKLEPVATNYDLPYKLLGRTDRVLVVGSGMGNDVAASLRSGAKTVTAVDIDPAIIRLGKELHPEHPLADARVTPVVDDARAYFRRTSRNPDGPRYDLAVFGLLDSQTALSSMSSVRLEFYVYTVESIKEAVELLDKEHGLAVVTFSVGWRTWVGERLFRTIAEAVGSDPLALETTAYDGGVTFVAGPGLGQIDRSRFAQLGVVDVSSKYRGPSIPCRDDWPFLYVSPQHWPWVYLVALGLLLSIGSLLVLRAMKTSAPEADAVGPRFDVHMFLMGASFMLVETAAIARLSLLFGATWLVNAAVISGVLLMVLASNALVAVKRSPPIGVSYALLCASLGIIYFLPFENFVATAGGWITASLLVALPVLFSGFVFSAAFRVAPNPHVALGCNMLGSILGGALEAVSLATGIRALALIALAIYGLSAFVLMNRGKLAPVVAETPA